MRRAIRPLLAAFGLAFGLCLAPAALAQDEWEQDDDIIFEGEEEPEEEVERLEEGDDLESVDDAGDDTLEEFSDPTEETGEEDQDLLGEDAGPPPAVESGDTAQIYREKSEEIADWAPDEQIQAWEVYLAEYPNTPFRERITTRIAELEQQMYDSNIGRGGDGIDAMEQELNFAQALQLENIDPRNRFQVGFEWGLPDYINLFLDYERAFARTFSAHIGVRRRYTGYSIEPGVHWALVKSTRTNTLVTLIADAHFNTNPAYLGVRPQLAFGKRFGKKLDAQLQLGTDLELRNPFGLRLVGGISATYAASDAVRIFLESGYDMKDVTRSGGFYRFNVITFGMKFFPKRDSGQVSDDVEVNMGASVPYSTNYWQFHYGSVMGQANIYH